MDDIKIMTGGAEHADAVAALWTQMAAQHKGFDAERWQWSPDAVDRCRERYLELVAEEGGVALVAVAPDGRVLAYLQGSVGENRPNRAVRLKASVHTLVVDERFRSRQLGRRLMDAAMARFRELGAGEMALHCAVSNDGARRFYERLGMRPVSHEMYCRL
jgi:ribosomal protein S18 acetylase RimI-like enzyme